MPQKSQFMRKVDVPRSPRRFSRILVLGVPAVAAILAASLAGRFSPATRLANLRLDGGGIRDTYLMLSKSASGRCYAVNRRAATVRRSNPSIRGRMQYCTSFNPDQEGTRGPDYWFIHPGRKRAFFLVPVGKVADWTYPFLYDFVRRAHKDLNLPRSEWTQLFVNRLYRGLYLRVSLPYDSPRESRGFRFRREFLNVDGYRMTHVDTRFDAAGSLYLMTVAAGIFPELLVPKPPLVWLARHRPYEETTLILDNAPPYRVSLMPLPVSLDELSSALRGRPLPQTLDERFERWTEEAPNWPRGGKYPPSAEMRSALEAGFFRYTDDFLRAYKVHTRFRRTPAELAARFLSSRRAAAAAVGLALRMGEA